MECMESTDSERTILAMAGDICIAGMKRRYWLSQKIFKSILIWVINLTIPKFNRVVDNRCELWYNRVVLEERNTSDE